jgi:hypothetical protein
MPSSSWSERSGALYTSLVHHTAHAPARTMPSVQRMPTHVPALLMASIAYSTWWSRPWGSRRSSDGEAWPSHRGRGGKQGRQRLTLGRKGGGGRVVSPGHVSQARFGPALSRLATRGRGHQAGRPRLLLARSNNQSPLYVRTRAANVLWGEPQAPSFDGARSPTRSVRRMRRADESSTTQRP